MEPAAQVLYEREHCFLAHHSPDTQFLSVTCKGQRAEIFRPQTYEQDERLYFQIYISTRKVDKNGKTVCTKYLHRAECVCDCLQI